MSAQELRVEIAGLMTEVRSAGRGASRSTLGAITDKYFPRLLAAADAHASESLSAAAKERGLARLIEEAGEARLRPSDASGSSTDGVPARWPWTRKKDGDRTGMPSRRSWVWGLAGATALMLFGFMLYNLLAPENQIVAPKDRPGITGPDSPIPQPPSPRPDGQVVEKGPETDIGSRPVPRLRERERVVAVEQPVVGEFTKVMGEPVLVAAGTRPIPAQPGMKIAQGSRIETGDMDKAEIRLGDGSVIMLDFNTTLTVRADPEGRLLAARDFDLTSGRIMAKVVHTLDDDRFTVRTPVATAEVLGTEFFLGLEKIRTSKQSPEGAPPLKAVLQVKEGQVAFYNDFGRVVAPAMSESSAATGTAPTEPKKLASLGTFRIGDLTLVVGTVTYPIEEMTWRFVHPARSFDFSTTTLESGEVIVVWLGPNGNAERAGMQLLDRIVAVAGRPVTHDRELRWMQGNDADSLPLEILRDGTPVTLILTSRVDPLPPGPNDLAPELFQATRFALNQGDADRALRELMALSIRRPHATVFNNIGLLNLLRGEMGAAIRNFRQAVQREPNYWLYHYNLGLALRDIGNFERAAEELSLAFSQVPDRWHWAVVEVLNDYTDILTLLDRFEEALIVLDKATRRWPRNGRVWNSKSEVLLRAGRPQDALTSASEAERLAPYQIHVLFNLAQVHYALGQYDRAAAVSETVVRLYPENVEARVNHGSILSRQGRLEEAEREFRRGIALDPDRGLGYAGLGGTLYRQGRKAEAEEALRRAVEIDPQDWIAWETLATVAWGSGRSDEAETIYRKLIRAHPFRASNYRLLAVLLSQVGRHEDAVEIYRRAVEIMPEDPALRVDYAQSLYRGGHNRESLVQYRAAWRLDPNRQSALTGIARVLAELEQDLDEAVRLGLKGIDLAPNTLNRDHAICTVGWVYFKLGDLKNAHEYLSRALLGTQYGERPVLGPDWELLGIVSEKLGENDQAKNAYRRALQLDPKRAKAEEGLKRLGG